MSTDGPDGPDAADARQGARGVVAALVVLCGLAVGVVVLVVVVGQTREDAPDVSLAGSTPSVEFLPPVPLAVGQAYIRTELLPSGDLLVTHWIRSSEPLDSMLLSRPDISDQVELKAEQVRVVADGQIVVGPERVSIMAGRYTFASASTVQVEYLLSGAVRLSGSAPGRALARTSSLDVTYEPASTRVIRSVLAPEVLSLACSRPVRAAPSMPCGNLRSRGEWTVELDGPDARDRVMAQVNVR